MTRASRERRLAVVPRWVLVLLVAAFVLQAALAGTRARPVARAEDLAPVPPVAWLRVAALGEPIAFGYGMALYLQAFDNQPGISIPFRELDYPRVIGWLAAILELDPRNQYPLLLATQVYPGVSDPARKRLMADFVHQQFLLDPEQRWRWLAYTAILAKHRLADTDLALRYARDIARLARTAPGWARQMHIFLLEDLGELDSAKILLGGLLASGEVKDEREQAFLTERLNHLKNAEKPTAPSKK
ncbi:MAG: hypothetical protein ACREUW_12060 [Burkholderiales bacterium]